MSAPILTKTYRAWIDTAPGIGPRSTPQWVEVEFVKLTGTLSIRATPYLDATLTVRIPESVPRDRYDARKYTRVRLEAATPAATSLPWAYIRRARTIDERAGIYELHLYSEDGRLLEPANTTAEPIPHRATWQNTLDVLIPYVCGAYNGALDLVSGVPVSGVRCDPVYEKANLLFNPIGYPPSHGGQPWAVTSSAGGGGHPHTTTPPQASGSATQPLWFLCHPNTEPGPAVTAGETYRFTMELYLPSSSPLIGRTLNAEMKYAYHHAGGARFWPRHHQPHVLRAGYQTVTMTAPAPLGASNVAVGGELVGTPPTGAVLQVRWAMLCEVDPGDPPTEYWDGTTPATAQYEYGFSGEAWASPSIRYPRTPRSLDSALLMPGDSEWSILEPHLSRMGWRLVPDTPGKWRVVATGTFVPDLLGTVFYADDFDGTDAATVERETDRTADGFADAIVLRYRWRSGRHGEQEAWDTASVAGTATRPKLIEVEQPYPGAGGAARRLAVSQLAGDPVTATAPLDLWWKPGDSMVASGRDLCLIESISFDTDTDLMTLTGAVHQHFPS